MRPDIERSKEARAWLQKAAHDLRCARLDLDALPPVLSDAAFHCQQAAEKALKGFLTWNDCAFRRTHDLGEIGAQCLDFDASLEPLCRRAEGLTVYAWMFRYPGDTEEPERDDVEEALAVATEMYEAVLARLPADAPP